MPNMMTDLAGAGSNRAPGVMIAARDIVKAFGPLQVLRVSR